MSEPVRRYYSEHVSEEWTRLESPLGHIEFLSTMLLIDRYFPSSGEHCDIGSGPGRYAVELAGRGHSVTLVDLSQPLLDHAQAEFTRRGLAARRFVCADARDLSMLNDNSFESALLLGPLYHLVKSEDRLDLLHELQRVLVDGGVAILAYLNSWGIMRTGLTDFPDRYVDADFQRSMLDEATFEQSELVGFTECYWSTPPAALAEVRKSGLEVLTYIGAEGFVGGLGRVLSALREANPSAYRSIATVAAETSELPQFRDATDHLHIVVRNGTKSP